ncbi:MAG: large conductance mechanosensitive channel protein MscL, partial [Micrococcus sp.]|nr:large conductance mechanosensitive channel protein MscL [Micrococcus sp.]
AAVYFAIVLPMNKMIERRNRRLGIEPEPEPVAEDVALLTEIRDLLSAQRGGTGTVTNGPVPGGPTAR